jgi:hypothetical protein
MPKEKKENIFLSKYPTSTEWSQVLNNRCHKVNAALGT